MARAFNVWEEGCLGEVSRQGSDTSLTRPSARLSLVGLRPRRARLRFTRRADGNEPAQQEQEQRPGAGQRAPLDEVYP